MLTELLLGIHNGIGSEVPQAFKDTSANRIIAISGFKLFPIDTLRSSNGTLENILIRALYWTELLNPGQHRAGVVRLLQWKSIYSGFAGPFWRKPLGL